MNSPARNVRAVVTRAPCCPRANKRGISVSPCSHLLPEISCVVDQNHLPTDTQMGSVKHSDERSVALPTARELQTCTFQGPCASKTPPEFNEKTPKREKTERKLWREGKKVKFWAQPFGAPPSGPHPWCPHNSFPHPSGPYLSWFGPPTPSVPPLPFETSVVCAQGTGLVLSFVCSWSSHFGSKRFLLFVFVSFVCETRAVCEQQDAFSMVRRGWDGMGQNSWPSSERAPNSRGGRST